MLVIISGMVCMLAMPVASAIIKHSQATGYSVSGSKSGENSSQDAKVTPHNEITDCRRQSGLTCTSESFSEDSAVTLRSRQEFTC